MNFILNLFPQYRRLRKAALLLYYAGHWSRPDTLEWQDADYWVRLRNALGLPEGTTSGQ